jgi:protein-glutamine gamma-glutamyltransferase
MIKISDGVTEPNTIIDQYASDSIERKILDILSKSSTVYTYDSVNQLKFELSLRKSIIGAARDLDRSHFAFRVFRKSKCNSDYWHRTSEGGFLLENGVKPSDAIKDIYIHSSQYGTECSTAMVIVYYKALVDILSEELFNKLFSEIYLMNWQHLDADLGIVDYDKLPDYLPGDARYFKNPDVDPLSPEWQGENVFDLGDGTYYGHGLGIASPERIIEALNKKRIKDSHVSAYLLDSAKRPNFKYLASK